MRKQLYAEKIEEEKLPPSHVAGIIAGDGKASMGMIKGTAWESEIVAVRVLDDKGKGRLGAMLEGIRWLSDNYKKYNVRIVNISVGTVKKQKENSQLVKAVESLWEKGLIVCTAAGNEGSTGIRITSPGIGRKVITVGSCDDSSMIDDNGKEHRNYSGRGPTAECICKPEIVAPGTNILSLNAVTEQNPGYYTSKSGTSMSTPLVSGALALLLEKYPDADNKNVKLRLWETALRTELEDNQQGWGRLDVRRLLGYTRNISE